MNKNEQKAKELGSIYARQYHHNTYPEITPNSEFVFSSNEIEIACNEMAKWKDAQYKEIIDMLIDKLQTSKNYHLGITGLDTDEEIREKRIKGECTLIRGIESTIKLTETLIKEMKEE